MIDATVGVPGSKSLTNRALVCAALAEGTSTITGALVADDTAAMGDCLRALGAGVEWDGTTVTVVGVAGRIDVDEAHLDARLSGTTSRFVLPLLALGSGRYTLDGKEPLRRRPMGPSIDALRDMGVAVEELGEPGHLPVVVSGPVRGGEAAVRGDLSSQFVSGLLLAAPAMPGGLRVTIRTSLVAAPFVAMTTAVMRAFGADVQELDVRPGGYRSREYAVEPDASAASYFLAAAAIAGGRVTVGGLGRESLQGDLRFVDVLERMGATIELTDVDVSVTGGDLRGIDVDLSAMPDMAQTFAVVAACADGPSRVSGVSVIRGHETDRITAVVNELRRCGVGAEETDDGFVIEPAQIRPATIQTYDDHRMAMSFALLGLRQPGIEIADPDVVGKTFPGFWDALARLRS
ncbi:MAG: 3-phosphoshikimate 1-carboxyvinyltransferase [Acidimicrobiales bacterium]|nr:3-phosphoshikimate 1-carboxyvinyltransferase [Acidimicrobiales bacterium]